MHPLGNNQALRRSAAPKGVTFSLRREDTAEGEDYEDETPTVVDRLRTDAEQDETEEQGLRKDSMDQVDFSANVISDS